MHSFILFIFAVFLIQGNGSGDVRYRYVFENSRFLTTMQELDFDAAGQGKYSYKRQDNNETITVEIVLSPILLSQIKTSFDDLMFLDSSENYQYKKDFSHLGNMTVYMTRGGKERSVKFSYTENKTMARLVEIFRNIANQESRILEIENIRATDTISMPAQLRQLESELKSNRLADPARFTALLIDLKNDETIPLIARNHAERLLKMLGEK